MEKFQLKTSADVNADTVVVTTQWSPSSSQSGVWSQQLWVPESLAQDLRVEFDGNPVFSNFDFKSVAPPIQLDVSKISFIEASTSKTLFQISGTFPRVHMAYNPAKRGDIHITVYSSRDGKTGNLMDLPESIWTITFP